MITDKAFKKEYIIYLGCQGKDNSFRVLSILLEDNESNIIKKKDEEEEEEKKEKKEKKKKRLLD